MALNVSFTAIERVFWSFSRGISRSVRIYANMVAMFGSTIPAPFAIATILHLPSLATTDLNLGYLSVVVIPNEAGYADLLCIFDKALGTAFLMASIGSLQPIIPVELGKTKDFEDKPASFATCSHIKSLSPAPPSPMPPGHTLDILLFTTIACNFSLFLRRSFPTIIGPPGKRFDVNIAANEEDGLSVIIRVRFIGKVLSTSTGLNWNLVVPTEKPPGRVACAFRFSR
mmetsp:Transcript_11741/g.11808  ORF Transcript_11741/g.11808 Transcript_11741/m.11808 type:complete len:228 (-) Transcript_11741:199-882(-)